MDVDAYEDENRRHDTLFRTIESLEPTSTIIEEAIKAIGPEANDYGCTSRVCLKRSADIRCQRDLQQVKHHLGKTKKKVEMLQARGGNKVGRTVCDSQSNFSISPSPHHRPRLMAHP